MKSPNGFKKRQKKDPKTIAKCAVWKKIFKQTLTAFEIRTFSQVQ